MPEMILYVSGFIIGFLKQVVIFLNPEYKILKCYFLWAGIAGFVFYFF